MRFGSTIIRLDETLRRWSPDTEEALRAVVHSELRNGDTMLDIGANFGLHTLYAAKLVTSAGHVYAFEPAPQNVRLLRRNVRLNKLDTTVTIVPSVVSNSSEPFLELHVPDECVAVTASLRKVTPGERLVRVTNMRLDDFGWHSNASVRLMKIDVEGAELEVLRGALNIIKCARPVLVIEVHGFALPEFGASADELEEFLQGLGYRKTLIDDPHLTAANHYQAVYRPAVN